MRYAVQYAAKPQDRIICNSLEAAKQIEKDLVDLKLTKKCKITKE